MYKKQIEIYQAFKSGKSIKYLSKKYNVPKSEIESIIRYYLSPIRLLLSFNASIFLIKIINPRLFL